MKWIFRFLKKRPTIKDWQTAETNDYREYLETLLFISSLFLFLYGQFYFCTVGLLLYVVMKIDQFLFYSLISSIKILPNKKRRFYKIGDQFEIEIPFQNQSKFSVKVDVHFSISRNVQCIGLKFLETSEVTDVIIENIQLKPGMNRVKVPFQAVGRGELTFGNLFLKLLSPLGIEKREFMYQRLFQLNDFIYPNAKLVLHLLDKAHLLQEGRMSRVGVLEDRLSLNGIRDYVPGDPFRKIDWKSTAKQGHLQVKVFDYTQRKAVFFVVDLSQGYYGIHKEMEKFLSILTGYLETMEKEGIEYGFAINCQSFSTRFCKLEIGLGPAHFEQALAVIASIPTSPKIVDMSKVLPCLTPYEHEVVEWIHIGSQNKKVETYYQKVLPEATVKSVC